MEKIILIINEQHTLFPEQEALMTKLGDYKTIKSPSTGWTKEDMDKFTKEYGIGYRDTIVFASPIPYLLKKLSSELHYFESLDMSSDGVELMYKVLVFHNDNREKVELPNGKIINKVASTGWQLV